MTSVRLPKYGHLNRGSVTAFIACTCWICLNSLKQILPHQKKKKKKNEDNSAVIRCCSRSTPSCQPCYFSGALGQRRGRDTYLLIFPDVQLTFDLPGLLCSIAAFNSHHTTYSFRGVLVSTYLEALWVVWWWDGRASWAGLCPDYR